MDNGNLRQAAPFAGEPESLVSRSQPCLDQHMSLDYLTEKLVLASKEGELGV